jgi:DNA-binding transcriptional LysR family regulator
VAPGLYFVTVVEEANFTRAAARLHVAQPGVSAQVRRLERELGEELLDGAGRTVRLTEMGAAVLPYARAALGAVSGARAAGPAGRAARRFVEHTRTALLA